MTDEPRPDEPTDDPTGGPVVEPGEPESDAPDAPAAPNETVPIVPRQLPSAASFFGEPRPPRHSAHAEPVAPTGPVRWEDPPAPTTGVIDLGQDDPHLSVPSEPVDAPVPVTPPPALSADEPVFPDTPPPGEAPQPPVFRQTFVPVDSAPQPEPEPEGAPVDSAPQPEPEVASVESAPQPEPDGAPADDAAAADQAVASPPSAPHPLALDLAALRGSTVDDDEEKAPSAAPSVSLQTMPVPVVPLDTDSLPTHDEPGETATAAFGAVFGATPTAPTPRQRSETSFTELISVPAEDASDSGHPTSFDWSSLPAPVPENDEPKNDELAVAPPASDDEFAAAVSASDISAPAAVVEPSENTAPEDGAGSNDQTPSPEAVPPLDDKPGTAPTVAPSPWWLADRAESTDRPDLAEESFDPAAQSIESTDRPADPGSEGEATFTDLLGIVPPSGDAPRAEDESVSAAPAVELAPPLAPWSLTGDLSSDVVPPVEPASGTSDLPAADSADTGAETSAPPLPSEPAPAAVNDESEFASPSASGPTDAVPAETAPPETVPIDVPFAAAPALPPAPHVAPAEPTRDADGVAPPTDPVVALFGADLFGIPQTPDVPLPAATPSDDEESDSSWAEEPRAPIPPAVVDFVGPPTEAYTFEQNSSPAPEVEQEPEPGPEPESDDDEVEPTTRLLPTPSSPEAAASAAEAASADPFAVAPAEPTFASAPAAWSSPQPQYPPRVPPTGGSGTGGFSSLPRERRRLIAILVAVAFVVVLVLLFILGRALVSHASSASDTAAQVTSSAAAKPTPTPTPTRTATPSPAVAAGPAAPGKHAWTDLQGGECLSSFENAWQQTYDVVACATAHPAQMILKGTLPAAAGAVYPGDSALQSELGLTCSSSTAINMTAAQAYTGVQISASYPTADQWSAGSRTYYCFASRSDGQTMTTSVATAS